MKLAVFVACAAAILGACGGGSASTDGTPPTGAEGPVGIQAADNRFVDEEVRVTVGTEIVWTNTGRNNHDIVPVDGSSWGITLADFVPKTSYSHVFDEPGTYGYYCSVHGTKKAGMKGTIVVEK